MFDQLLELRLGLVRISAYWDEIRKNGYAELDWILDAARGAGQSILLTVGMKAIRWPEFYIPPDLEASAHRDGRIGLDSPLSQPVITFVSEAVARYRDRPHIVGWQVENEPFNRSGPQRWWIDPRLVRREVEAVRDLDPRPIVLNAFAHFDSHMDRQSRPRWRKPEKEIIDVADILGLDVYTTIGARTASADWDDSVGRWLGVAEKHGKRAWIIESQAEPWNSPSFAPNDMLAIYERLARAGFSTILLWGCENWFATAAAGDSSWLDAAKRLVDPRGFEPLTF